MITLKGSFARAISGYLLSDCGGGTDFSTDPAPCADRLIDAGLPCCPVPEKPRALEDPRAQAVAPAGFSQAALLIHLHIVELLLLLAPHQSALPLEDQHLDPFPVLEEFQHAICCRSQIKWI